MVLGLGGSVGEGPLDGCWIKEQDTCALQARDAARSCFGSEPTWGYAKPFCHRQQMNKFSLWIHHVPTVSCGQNPSRGISRES